MTARRTSSRAAALLSAATLAIGGLTVAASSATAAEGCRVDYTVQSQWPGGFQGDVKITNLGSAINGWTLAFTFGNAGQKVGQAWSANVTQTGTAVTASNLSYNGALAPGASTSFGFNGTHTGANPRPTGFTLNGAACTVS